MAHGNYMKLSLALTNIFIEILACPFIHMFSVVTLALWQVDQ